MRILLVDDDDVDVYAVTRTLTATEKPHELTVFPNGQAAQQALRGPFGRTIQSEPYIIFLDLNMPVMNGWQFLTWIQGEADLKGSVIFVFTVSDEPEDIARAYGLPIAGYIIKSHLGSGYERLGGLVDAYALANTFVLKRGSL